MYRRSAPSAVRTRAASSATLSPCVRIISAARAGSSGNPKAACQVISSARGQNANGNFRVSRHGVQQGLNGSIATQREYPFTSRSSLFPRNLRKFRRTFRAAEFRVPLFFARQMP